MRPLASIVRCTFSAGHVNRPNQSMKRLAVTSLILAAVVLGIEGIIVAFESNPLRRSDEEIRKSILQKTPLGSSRPQVMAAIAKEPWIGHDGYIGAGRPPSEGVAFYGADLGSHWGLLGPCHAHAYWSFDDADTLIAVHVTSWCEGL
jgi:hypothetical protein